MQYTPESGLTQDQHEELMRVGWDGQRSLIYWVIETISSLRREKWRLEQQVQSLKAHQGSNPNGLSFGE